MWTDGYRESPGSREGGDTPPKAVERAYPGVVSDNDWRDAPLLPEQTEDDIDREPSDNDDRLREEVPPHHGD